MVSDTDALRMTHFYFVRHGQTDANRDGLMCGASWNIGLNEEGLEQATLAADKLWSSAVEFSAIYSSPLLRACQTARLIAERFKKCVEIIDELQEWDIGSWDRVPFESVKEEFLGLGEPVGGETRAQFRQRVAAVLQRVLKESQPVLLVSHGAVWLAMQDFLRIPVTRVENGIPLKITFFNNGWHADSA